VSDECKAFDGTTSAVDGSAITWRDGFNPCTDQRGAEKSTECEDGSLPGCWDFVPTDVSPADPAKWTCCKIVANKVAQCGSNQATCVLGTSKITVYPEKARHQIKFLLQKANNAKDEMMTNVVMGWCSGEVNNPDDPEAETCCPKYYGSGETGEECYRNNDETAECLAEKECECRTCRKVPKGKGKDAKLTAIEKKAIDNIKGTFKCFDINATGTCKAKPAVDCGKLSPTECRANTDSCVAMGFGDNIRCLPKGLK
jgi:hypothetical protein